MQYISGAEDSLGYGEVNRAVESAFADHGMGLVQMPPKVYITLPAGDFRTMPAYLPSLKIAGVKIVNVHPENRSFGLPTVMALTVILDIATGKPCLRILVICIICAVDAPTINIPVNRPDGRR